MASKGTPNGPRNFSTKPATLSLSKSPRNYRVSPESIQHRQSKASRCWEFAWNWKCWPRVRSLANDVRRFSGGLRSQERSAMRFLRLGGLFADQGLHIEQ